MTCVGAASLVIWLIVVNVCRLLNLMDNIEARVQPVMRVSVHHHVLELQLACYPPQITELCRALVGPTFVLCDVRVAG